MNAGTPPEPGMSRLTIRTYRLNGHGRRVGETEPRAFAPGSGSIPPVSLGWPRCHCPRCRTGYGPRGH